MRRVVIIKAYACQVFSTIFRKMEVLDPWWISVQLLNVFQWTESERIYRLKPFIFTWGKFPLRQHYYCRSINKSETAEKPEVMHIGKRITVLILMFTYMDKSEFKNNMAENEEM